MSLHQRTPSDGLATLPPSRPESRNFSRPRPDGPRVRHEPSSSLSSINSTGSSVPALTDGSDSEVSTDEDYHYNSSANQLWNSFWPMNGKLNGSQVVLAPPQTSAPRNQREPNVLRKVQRPGSDATITVPKQTVRELATDATPRGAAAANTLLDARPQNIRAAPPNHTDYPKSTQSSVRQSVLGARPASQASSPELSSPRQLSSSPSRRRLRNSRSFATLSYSRSVNHKPSLSTLYSSDDVPPPIPPINQARFQNRVSRPPLPLSSQTEPVSSDNVPAWNMPRPARLSQAQPLRAAASAYNLREQAAIASHHNRTAPLAPLVRPAALQIEESRPISTQIARLAAPQQPVSVFELDSDVESEDESSLTKRIITRGLHKKTQSERHVLRGSVEGTISNTGSTTSLAAPSESRGESPARRRGGSLGRMFGLKPR